MAVSRQELQALENQLVEAGISRNVARSRVQEIERGASGRQVFDLLFQNQIDKVTKDAMADLFKVRIPALRAQAFDQGVKRLLNYRGKRPGRADARRNLALLGLPHEFIEWAVTQRIPFTPAKIAKEVVKLQRKGKTQEQAWREGLKLASQDHIIEAAMRADIRQLGMEPATIIAIITLIVSVLYAIYEVINQLVIIPHRQEKREKEAKKERQNLPLTEVEKRELVVLMENKATWAEASQVALDYIKNFREGRKGFRGNEESSIKTMWAEARKAESELAREERLEQILYAGETARIRRAGRQAAELHAGWERVAGNVERAEAQVASLHRERLVRKVVDIGVPAVVGTAIVGSLVLLARRGN